jgi:hypothetical protein
METLVGITKRACSSSSGHLQKGGFVALTPALDVKDLGTSLRLEIVNTRAKDLQRKIDQDLAGIGLLPAV